MFSDAYAFQVSIVEYIPRMITAITAIIGAVLGAIGTTMGVLNFLRDRPRIKIVVRYDWQSLDGTPIVDGEKLIGFITVTNTGRRPIYISHIHMIPPKGSGATYLIIKSGIAGTKIAEADPPYTVPFSQNGLADYAEKWKEIRACVIDSTDKHWYSDPPGKKAVAPSWAKRGAAAHA